MRNRVLHYPVARQRHDSRMRNTDDSARCCGRVVQSTIEKYDAMLYAMETMIAVQSILDANPDHRAKLFQLKEMAVEARKKLQNR